MVATTTLPRCRSGSKPVSSSLKPRKRRSLRAITASSSVSSGSRQSGWLSPAWRSSTASLWARARSAGSLNRSWARREDQLIDRQQDRPLPAPHQVAERRASCSRIRATRSPIRQLGPASPGPAPRPEEVLHLAAAAQQLAATPLELASASSSSRSAPAPDLVGRGQLARRGGIGQVVEHVGQRAGCLAGRRGAAQQLRRTSMPRPLQRVDHVEAALVAGRQHRHGPLRVLRQPARPASRPRPRSSSAGREACARSDGCLPGSSGGLGWGSPGGVGSMWGGDRASRSCLHRVLVPGPVDQVVGQVDDAAGRAARVGQLARRRRRRSSRKSRRKLRVGGGEGLVDGLVGVAHPHPVAVRARPAGAGSAPAAGCCPGPRPPGYRASGRAAAPEVSVAAPAPAAPGGSGRRNPPRRGRPARAGSRRRCAAHLGQRQRERAAGPGARASCSGRQPAGPWPADEAARAMSLDQVGPAARGAPSRACRPPASGSGKSSSASGWARSQAAAASCRISVGLALVHDLEVVGQADQRRAARARCRGPGRAACAPGSRGWAAGRAPARSRPRGWQKLSTAELTRVTISTSWSSPAGRRRPAARPGRRGSRSCRCRARRRRPSCRPGIGEDLLLLGSGSNIGEVKCKRTSFASRRPRSSESPQDYAGWPAAAGPSARWPCSPSSLRPR